MKLTEIETQHIPLEGSPKVLTICTLKKSNRVYVVEVDQATNDIQFNNKARSKFVFYRRDGMRFSLNNSFMKGCFSSEILARNCFEDLKTWISNPRFYESIRQSH